VNDRMLPRPFLKWAGGKTQLVDKIIERLPFRFENYHEPFLGGGALFFKLCRERRFKHAVISDLNSELIDVYCAIRDCLDDVVEKLTSYPHDEVFYYELRAKRPADLSLPERAARMIYLNKTGYNGLYRVNRAGQFNVPFGRYDNPNFLDADNLKAVSNSLKGVEIENATFETVLDHARAGDLVYFDPPYVPVSRTANFTSYQANGFSLDDQIRLRDVCIELTNRKIHVILSNSGTETVRELFKSFMFCQSEVLASRAINCLGNRRGKTRELIVTNYPLNHAVQPQLLDAVHNFSAKVKRTNKKNPIAKVSSKASIRKALI